MEASKGFQAAQVCWLPLDGCGKARGIKALVTEPPDLLEKYSMDGGCSRGRSKPKQLDIFYQYIP